MAVVGEAHIIVKAITTGVANDIRKGLQGASGGVNTAARRAGEGLGEAFSRGFNTKGANIFTKVSEGLKAMVPDATAAARQFRSMTRTGYSLGTVVSVLIGSIGTLVGSLGALIGALGAAAPAAIALAGTFVTLRIAASGISFAMKGIGGAVSQATQANTGLGKSLKDVREEMQKLKFDAEEAALSEERAALNLEKARQNLIRVQDLPPNSVARREAELAYKEAELAYRRAKDQASDMGSAIEEGMDVGGGVDPYAGLTESQKKFAKFLVTLKPMVDRLREAIAKGFLPVLQTQIERLLKTVDGKLEPAFERLGVSLGVASENFTNAFIEGGGPDKLIEILDAALPNIEKFGTILGQLFETILDLLTAAQPLTDKFIDFLGKGVQDFSNYIDKVSGNGELEAFFLTAGEMAGQLGDIFGNVFGGFGEIIKANFGPGTGGYELLEYFKEATAGFAALDGEATGEGSLRQYFIDVVENVKPLLGFLGDLGKILLGLGDNPALGETFNTMREGLPNLEAILEKLIEAGPDMAELGNNLGRFLNALTDSEAPKIFFDTLNAAVSGLADFFENETVKAITDVISRVFAFVSAISLIGSTALFFGKVFVGAFAGVFGVIGKVVGVFKGIGTAMSLILKNGLFKGLTIFFRSIIAFGGPIAAVFAKIGLFIMNFLGGALKFVLGLLPKIGMALRVALSANPIGAIITAISLVVTGLIWFFTQTELGKELWANFTQFLSEAFANIGQWFSDLGVWLGEVWNGFVGFITDGWNGFIGFFQDAITNIGGFFEDVWENISNFFRDLINGLIGLAEGFVNGFLSGINNIIDGLNSIETVNLLDPFGPPINPINIPRVGLVTLPRLADGGTVFPSPGGSLVNVAEAGRPERIEPLDADGLSDRDKALISFLSGGTAAGVNITVNPSPGMDEQEIANIVSRKLAFQLRKGGF